MVSEHAQNPGTDVTIVMYHYVRDLEKSRFPRIKARRTEEFRSQLDHIQANYTPVKMSDVIASMGGESDLPANAILLTFDDGYMDHFVNVMPMLDERGIEGCFFPPAQTVLEGTVLDVNKIQFTLASHETADPLVADIRSFVESADPSVGLKTFDEYWDEYAKPSRFDEATTMFVKRMLQFGLPEEPRRELVASLFERHVTADEAAFSAELYMGVDQLRMLARSGMPLGSHSYTHRWLNQISESEQLSEIDRSLEFLSGLGVSRKDWLMCYPFGGYNETTLEILRDRGCGAGLATDPRIANVSRDDPLLLPRLDTNDLPQ